MKGKEEEEFFSDIIAEGDLSEYKRKKNVLDDLEKEIILAERMKREEEESSEKGSIKALEESLGTESLLSPELGKTEEELEEEEDEERRKFIILRIREILASNAKNRSEQLQALMASAPGGMTKMISAVIQRYAPVLNAPGDQVTGPEKINASAVTIRNFSGYDDRSERKREDPYGGSSDSASGFYSAANTPDFAAARTGPDTSAEAAVRRSLGLDERGKKTSYGIPEEGESKGDGSYTPR